MSTSEPAVILFVVALTLLIQLERINMLTTPSLPLYQHGMALYLLCFFFFLILSAEFCSFSHDINLVYPVRVRVQHLIFVRVLMLLCSWFQSLLSHCFCTGKSNFFALTIYLGTFQLWLTGPRGVGCLFVRFEGRGREGELKGLVLLDFLNRQPCCISQGSLKEHN